MSQLIFFIVIWLSLRLSAGSRLKHSLNTHEFIIIYTVKNRLFIHNYSNICHINLVVCRIMAIRWKHHPAGDDINFFPGIYEEKDDEEKDI